MNREPSNRGAGASSQKSTRQIAEAALSPIAKKAFARPEDYDAAVDALAMEITRHAYRREKDAIEHASLGYRDIIRALRRLADPMTKSVSELVLAYIETSPSRLAELVERQLRQDFPQDNSR